MSATLRFEPRRHARRTCLRYSWACLWVTEASPIAATALLPLVLLPLLGVSTIRQAAAPYSDPIIYLFMGGFLLALAMERWNLHRRIALGIISAVGTKPRSLIFGFLCAGAFISMWTSNSATAMMLLPIGVSVHTLMKNAPGCRHSARVRWARHSCSPSPMEPISAAWARSSARPPNAVLKAYMEKAHGIEIGFRPVDAPRRAAHPDFDSAGATHPHARQLSAWATRPSPGVREQLTAEREKLGRMSGPEWAVTSAFTSRRRAVGVARVMESRGSQKPAKRGRSARW